MELLQQYQDACGTPVTVFFDGRGSRKTKPKNQSGNAVEVLFSSSGQTADDLIERAAHRFQAYGDVLVVTDDNAERDIVGGFGGSTASCDNFIRMIQNALADLQENLNNHNRSERERFKQSRWKADDEATNVQVFSSEGAGCMPRCCWGCSRPPGQQAEIEAGAGCSFSKRLRT